MGRRIKRKGLINTEAVREFLNHLVAERHSLLLLVPLVLAFWAIERWVFAFSNWVPLVVAVWASLQVKIYPQKITFCFFYSICFWIQAYKLIKSFLVLVCLLAKPPVNLIFYEIYNPQIKLEAFMLFEYT